MVNKKFIKVTGSILLILTFFSLWLSVLSLSVNAIIESDYNFNLNQDADIKIACFNTDNSLCTNATSCFITINYPDNSNLIEGSNMTFGTNYYSYLVNASLLDQKGEYRTTINCIGGYNGYTSFIFNVAGNSLFGFNLKNQSNVILLFVMVLLYLGLMILGFTFKNFGFSGFGFFVGILIGLMLSGLHIFLTFLFIFINVVIFYTFAKKNK